MDLPTSLLTRFWWEQSSPALTHRWQPRHARCGSLCICRGQKKKEVKPTDKDNKQPWSKSRGEEKQSDKYHLEKLYSWWTCQKLNHVESNSDQICQTKRTLRLEKFMGRRSRSKPPRPSMQSSWRRASQVHQVHQRSKMWVVWCGASDHRLHQKGSLENKDS